MATSKQRAASQRNGRLSRGPKTDAGKRAASLNAIRHDLSARPDLNALNPHLDEIEQLILAEVPDTPTAKAIAGKILDYERTEAHQIQVAAREAAGKDGHLDAEVLEKQKVESMATAMWQGQMIRDLEQKGLSKHKKNELRVYRDALGFLNKMSVQREQTIVTYALQEAVSLRRYFKRASNQLIKAIKAIG